MRFREMRRKRQQLTEEACRSIFAKGTHGVLAVTGDGGYPYAVPMSYAFDGDRILFHCAPSGHKLDALSRDCRASFCVVDKDEVHPEAYTTYFASVVVFGRVRVLDDPAEKRLALEKLAARYSLEQEAGRVREIERLFDRVCMLEFRIEHMSGKQARELVKEGTLP